MANNLSLLINGRAIYTLTILCFFVCCQSERQAKYNPEKAQKIYSEHTRQQVIEKTSTLMSANVYDNIVYWNIYFADGLAFMAVDSVLDKETAKYMFDDLPHFKIGDMDISSAQTKKSPMQNISYLYNQKKDSYYAWFPQEWGAFALKNDSFLAQEFTTSSCVVDTIKYAFVFYENRINDRALYWEYERWSNFKIVKTKGERKYTVYSLDQTYHYNLLSAIIAEMNNFENTDSIINYLQNQCNFSGHSYYDARCKYFIDSPNKQYLYQINDTCTFSLNPYPFLAIYQKQSINDLADIELIYPDFTKEKIPEIAAYAMQTKPTLIYFKRAYRSGYRHEPYYYFIFYYIDFSPFLPPRLRDMQVVFPRRFGLS